MRTVVFYGDSNTYGFDPRGFGGGRYPLSSMWTTLVAEVLGDGWTVRNEGLNGRSLPAGLRSLEDAAYRMAGLTEEDVFAVMLGSNDLLMTSSPDAERTAARMDRFLDWLSEREGCPRLLVIAPPHIGGKDSPEPALACFYEASVRMNEAFRRSAADHGAAFADAADWEIGLAFDGVHFSEEGHRRFAGKLVEVLRSLQFQTTD